MSSLESVASIIFYDAAAVARSLGYSALIAALQAGFQADVDAFPRVVHAASGEQTRLLAMMTVSQKDAIGVKVATVFPDNPARARLPAIHALVLLFDGITGAPRAILDGAEITLRRTAAASALASSYLSRSDAHSLLVLGTGALAPHLTAAHATIRPIASVEIWGRSPGKAAAAAEACRQLCPGLEIGVSDDIERSAARADIISCATSAPSPILHGRWLGSGVHVDLVGSFSPKTREADDDVVRAARIFVDTREGALAESGDLLIPLATGVLNQEQIIGDLPDLCRGLIRGRRAHDETTVFKSVGCALEDLIAARLVVGSSASNGPR